MRILARLHCRSQQTGCGSPRGTEGVWREQGWLQVYCLVSYQNPSRKPLSQMEHSDHQLYQVMLKQSWKGCAGGHIQDGRQRDQGSRLYEPKKVPLCVCLVLDCTGVSCWWRRHKNQSVAWHLEGWSRKMERSWPAKTVGLSVEIMLRVMLWVTLYCVKLFPTVSWPEILHLKQILTLFWMQTQRQDAGWVCTVEDTINTNTCLDYLQGTEW